MALRWEEAMRWTRTLVPLLVGALGLLISGCQGTLPRQFVLVSTEARGDPNGVRVSSCVSPMGTGWRCNTIEDEGGLQQGQRARPFTPPGIVANPELYVVTWWGGQPGFNNLHFAVSEDGNAWDIANAFMLVGSAQVDDESRPAVAFHPDTRDWFVVFRDALSEELTLARFSIRCRPAAGSACQTDGRGVTEYTVSPVGTVTGLGVTSPQPPAVSYVEDSLVVAFRDGAGLLRTLLSTDGGTTFTPPPGNVATTNGAPVRSDTAPAMHNSVGTLFLATTDQARVPGSTDIRGWTSRDGLAWTPVSSLNAGSSLLSSYEPAIAGPQSEQVLAYPTPGQTTTTVAVGGGSLTLQTGTHRSVGLAHGP